MNGATVTSTRRTRRVPHRQLRQLRIDAGMATTDLAYRAGTTAKTIRMAEAGFVPGPRLQLAIAEVFGLRPTQVWPLDLQERR